MKKLEGVVVFWYLIREARVKNSFILRLCLLRV